MSGRIEAVTGMSWIEALCRTREFSEYLLYGFFVENDAPAAQHHSIVPKAQCISYWDDPTLSKDELTRLLLRADTDDVAFSIASFSGTPVATIREVVAESGTILTSSAVTRPAEFAASC